MVHRSNLTFNTDIKELRLQLLKAKQKIQITKEYKWQLWNDENTGNGKKLSENTYKRCVTRKLNGKKVRWLTRLDEKNCNDVAVNAKAKWIRINDETYKMI